MIRDVWLTGVVCGVLGSLAVSAQTPRVIPRPPAHRRVRRAGGRAPRPTATRRSRVAGTDASTGPAKTAEYDVETVAEGLNGRDSLPLPPRRPHHRRRAARAASRSSAKTARCPSRSAGLPSNLWARGGQGVFEVRPDRAFATNRTIYLTYTVLPEGADQAALPRNARRPRGREREALSRRQAPRGSEGAAERRGHRRTRDSGARRHAAS